MKIRAAITVSRTTVIECEAPDNASPGEQLIAAHDAWDEQHMKVIGSSENQYLELRPIKEGE